jgi:arsenate reductase (thioredoxin)
MREKPYNVLFVCTGNSARSILAEAIMNRAGGGTFIGHSAGSHPTGTVNPNSLELLESLDHPTDLLRSKDWLEFAADGAPAIDFVFTVCDQAAGEICPVWPGQPITAHWGLPDPAAVNGTRAEIAAAFTETYRMLNNRIERFINLPLASLDTASLKLRLDDVGRERPESA